MSAAATQRRLHRIGALISALPVLVILLSGLLLQLKKDVDWIQPPTRTGSGSTPELPFEDLLQVVRAVPSAEVEDWQDIERLDVRPDRGVIKVRARNRMEVQVDATSGEVLQVAHRRSDLIESLHDGSWFFSGAKLWLFLPAGLLLLLLWVSGVYLWLLPHLVRRRRRQAG